MILSNIDKAQGTDIGITTELATIVVFGKRSPGMDWDLCSFFFKKVNFKEIQQGLV